MYCAGHVTVTEWQTMKKGINVSESESRLQLLLLYSLEVVDRYKFNQCNLPISKFIHYSVCIELFSLIDLGQTTQIAGSNSIADWRLFIEKSLRCRILLLIKR